MVGGFFKGNGFVLVALDGVLDLVFGVLPKDRPNPFFDNGRLAFKKPGFDKPFGLNPGGVKVGSPRKVVLQDISVVRARPTGFEDRTSSGSGLLNSSRRTRGGTRMSASKTPSRSIRSSLASAVIGPVSAATIIPGPEGCEGSPRLDAIHRRPPPDHS